MSTKQVIFKLIFIHVFVLSILNTFSQNTDTIKVNITNQVYDTIRIYDTVVQYDTVWLEPKLKEINLSPSGGVFLTNWSKLDNENVSIISSKNYSFGLNTDFSFDQFNISTGIWITQFNEERQLKYSFTNIDSTFQTDIIPTTIMEYDTTGVGWQVEVYDSTYFDTVLNQNVTVIITDTLIIYMVDSTSIDTYDTVTNIVYDTITNDTLGLRSFNYKYLEIPIIFNYKIWDKNKLSFYAGIGVIAGLLIKYDSYYLNDDMNSIILQPPEENYKLLPSIWLSLEAKYKFNDSLSLSLRPYYTYGLRSVSKTGIGVYGIPQRYGLNFSVNFSF